MEEVIREFVETIRKWVLLVSKNRFDEACELLDRASNAEQKWNKENLSKVFLDYGGSEHLPRIENPYQMDLTNEEIYFYEFNDKTGWSVEYDIPINGEWSDLTAQFESSKKEDGYSFLLHDIHVL